MHWIGHGGEYPVGPELPVASDGSGDSDGRASCGECSVKYSDVVYYVAPVRGETCRVGPVCGDCGSVGDAVAGRAPGECRPDGGTDDAPCKYGLTSDAGDGASLPASWSSTTGVGAGVLGPGVGECGGGGYTIYGEYTMAS